MILTKNSRHIVEITELSPQGVGIGTLQGFPVFVDRALPGERVSVKVIKVAQNYSVGRLLDLRKPSGDRVEPFCPVFNRCGGCSLQHLSYKGQLMFKTAQVREHLSNATSCERIRLLQTIGMTSPRHYRNKAQYPLIETHGQILTGFYAKRSHEIIEHSVCAIQLESINAIIASIRQFLEIYKVSIYDETRRQGLLRHIMIRCGWRSGELMVVLVLNGLDFPQRDDFIAALREKYPNITSIVLNINKGQTNVILGKENLTIYGRDTLLDRLGDYEFEISPTSFYQVNPLQTELLYRKVVEYAELRGEERVADLYCGIGTLSVWLAQHAQKVYGVEVNKKAIADAQQNARINECNNIEFFAGQVEHVLDDLARQGTHMDVIVVDPPRKGCDERVLETIAAMQPKRMVYVSCNPATLARDLSFLAQHGFQAVEIQPVDMFPHTTHVECVAKIEFRATLTA